MASAGEPGADTAADSAKPKKKDRTHWLYIMVLVAIVAGIIVGLVAPETGASLGVLGTLFVDLIKMMISPVIFCTIVLGIGSVRKAASVGRVGGLALGYFVIMSTFALAIGLVVGNLIHPGTGLDIHTTYKAAAAPEGGGGLVGFVTSIIPTTLVSPLVGESVLSTLFVALLIGFAVQALGSTGEAALRGVAVFQRIVFKVLAMIM